ncbi:MAG TPA: polysaccharide biosynthesis tyrosine autokinase [Mycobacteriales bacterium]|nr:polysaccharide biosynthesis tyrosine autokinase [Mycobacteriales bacterium]
MDLRDFVRLLRRRWELVLALTLVGIGAAVGITEASTPMYQASVQTFVSLRDADGTSSAYQDNLFSQARVKSYAKIVDSPSITAQVVHDLALSVSPQRLARRITASVPPDTVLVDITVRDSSRTRARDEANAVGARFAAVVGRLEAPAPGQPSPVSVTVVRPADLPAAPITPRVPLNLGLGLLAGLGLGVGLAVLRDSLDTSVKTREDLQELTGSGALGIIGFDRRARSDPLITQLDSRSPRSEAFRGLRTNLRFVDVDAPPKVVVLTSCVSAEGKSTTTCNLGLTIASAGMRTVVVEADLRNPSVADYMGLEGAVGLTDVLSGGARLDDVLQQWGDLPLHVLASGELPPNPSELLSSTQMAELLARLRGRADFVLVDTPPLIPVTDAAALARECDGAILVVRYGRVDKDLVRRATESLGNVGARLLGTVLTMTPVKGKQGYYARSRTYHRPGPRVPAQPAAGPAAAPAAGSNGVAQPVAGSDVRT